jgi:riboflavin biosynthesis pyrimidine reductase
VRATVRACAHATVRACASEGGEMARQAGTQGWGQTWERSRHALAELRLGDDAVVIAVERVGEQRDQLLERLPERRLAPLLLAPVERAEQPAARVQADGGLLEEVRHGERAALLE